MRKTINKIKWLLCVLFGVFFITYLISLNSDNNFLVFNIKWLSNNFLLSIAGGALASLVIVLVDEVIQYCQLKHDTENTLLINLASLYGQFLIIQSNCKRALASQDAIADNLIQSACDNANLTADYINGIDYTPFCNNKIKGIITRYKTKHPAIKNILIGFSFYRIAFNEDKMYLIKRREREIVTSNCPNVNNTLHKIVKQTSAILTLLDTIITELDNELENNYDWEKRKQALNGYQENYVSQNLKDYLNEDIVDF